MVLLNTPRKRSYMSKLVTAARKHAPILVGAGALVAGGALASAGSAGAAQHLPNNSVVSKTVVNRTLMARDIKKDAIGHQRLTPGVRKELAAKGEGEQGPKGDKGDPGPKGDQGTKGDQGKPGKDGVSGYDVAGPTKVVKNAGTHSITMHCTDYVDMPKGNHKNMVAVGGGVKYDSGPGEASGVTMNGSYPSTLKQRGEDAEDGVWNNESWTVDFTTAKDGTAVQTFVLCEQAR